LHKTEITEKIRQYVKNYFTLGREKFVPGKTRIPLAVPAYGWREVSESIDSLLTTWVTMGDKVLKFELLFSRYIGVSDCAMVNSGSSANLIALSILTNPALKDGIRPREEIITPAVTWSTTVYPIVNVGATPVFVDVNLETYNIDVENLEKAVTKKTRAIMPVHLLGNPCEIKRILEIAQEHDLYVIEDCCEAHGAMVNGRKVGTFGDLATFSFFMSHHITTIEGGAVVTNNKEYAEIARTLRAHGWIRDLKDRKRMARKYKDLDERFLFVNLGYNMRPTEIQGAFGIHQIKKLEELIEMRRDNARFWTKELERHSDYLVLPSEKEGTRHVWFGYPITIRDKAPFTREEMTAFLEKRLIETRPIMAGNVTQQPVIRFIKHRRAGELRNSKTIMKRSFFFGSHHGIGKEERKYIADSIHQFIKTKSS